jgi:hypothetical protein
MKIFLSLIISLFSFKIFSHDVVVILNFYDHLMPLSSDTLVTTARRFDHQISGMKPLRYQVFTIHENSHIQEAFQSVANSGDQVVGLFFISHGSSYQESNSSLIQPFLSGRNSRNRNRAELYVQELGNLTDLGVRFSPDLFVFFAACNLMPSSNRDLVRLSMKESMNRIGIQSGRVYMNRTFGFGADTVMTEIYTQGLNAGNLPGSFVRFSIAANSLIFAALEASSILDRGYLLNFNRRTSSVRPTSVNQLIHSN